MKQADFYILPCIDDDGKFDFLGKLLTRIIGAGHQVYLCCDDKYSAEKTGDALWQFNSTSFLANTTPDQPLIAPITIGWDVTHNPQHLDVMVNYSQTIPEGAANFERVVELVTSEPDSLPRSRERYKIYKEQGFAIKNNDMRNKNPQR